VLKLMALIFLFSVTTGFACGYGVREWISDRRRKEARNLARRDPANRKHDQQLNTLENRIADTTSEIRALRDEARSELAAIRNLLERKSEIAEHRDNGVAPCPTSGGP